MQEQTLQQEVQGNTAPMGQAIPQQPAAAQSTIQEKPKSKKGLVIILIIVSLLICGGTGVGVYFYLQSQKVEDEVSEEEEVVTEEEEVDPYEGWKIYENEEFNFTMKYPQEWTSDGKTGPGDVHSFYDEDSIVLLNITEHPGAHGVCINTDTQLDDWPTEWEDFDIDGVTYVIGYACDDTFVIIEKEDPIGGLQIFGLLKDGSIDIVKDVISTIEFYDPNDGDDTNEEDDADETSSEEENGGETAPQCVAEGGSIVTGVGLQNCCEGLTKVVPCPPDVEGNCPLYPCSGDSVCIKCGDGKCGTYEDKCNCPGDCS